jgi:hypothetical protein
MREIVASVRGVASNKAIAAAQWQLALWGRNSVEPSMLRVPLVVIFFIGLWAGNLWIFEKCRVQYISVLGSKANALSFTMCATMVLAVGYTMHMQVCTTLLAMTVEVAVTWFYVVVLSVVFLLPVFLPKQSTRSVPNSPSNGGDLDTSTNSANKSAGNEPQQEEEAVTLASAWNAFLFYRKASLKVLRNVFFPGNSISFSEIMLADALTSLSKVFKDVGVTVIAMYAHMQGTAVVEYHEQGMLLVALLASLPALLRVRQCWVQFTGFSDPAAKILVALNIVKYCSSFPPIWLVAASALGYSHPALPMVTAAMSVINSVYSYLWDIMMDWGLIQFSMKKNAVCVCLRPRSLFFFPSMAYVFAITANLVLRFSWMANQLELFRGLHATQLVLLVELLEVIRRSIWNVFRVEWEIINKTMKERSMSKGDDEGLLLDGDYTYKDDIYTNDRDRGRDREDSGSGCGSPRHSVGEGEDDPKPHT